MQGLQLLHLPESDKTCRLCHIVEACAELKNVHGISGFLLGSRQTLLETKDSGKTWAPRSIAAAREEGFNYRCPYRKCFVAICQWPAFTLPYPLHMMQAGDA